MNDLWLIEIVSGVFIFLLLMSQIANGNRTKTLRHMKVLLALSILWLISDGLALYLNGPETPSWLITTFFFISYVMRPIFALSIGLYANIYLEEKGVVSKRWYVIPSLLQIIGIIDYFVAFTSGFFGEFVDGTFVFVDKIPFVALFLFIGFILYSPFPYFLLRKRIGLRPFTNLILFLLPITVTIIILQIYHVDFTILATAFSTIFLCFYFESDISKQYVIEKINSENNDRLLALEDDFESLYDVELKTGFYTLFNKKDSFSDIASQTKLKFSKNFFVDAIKNFDIIGCPEDKEKIVNSFNISFIRDALKDAPYYEFYYRLMIDGSTRWYKSRFVYSNTNKDHIIVGVFNADKYMNDRIKDGQIRDHLINNMLEEDAVFIVNIDEDTRKTVHNNTIDKDKYSDSEPFSVSINRFINSAIIQYDRKKARKMTNLANIKEFLKTDNEYKFRFREMVSGVQRFSEMKISKLSDSEILLSISEKDREFFDELIFDTIKEDYFAMLAVDTDEGFLRVINIDNATNGFNVRNGDIIKYKEYMLKISEFFTNDVNTKKHFANLSDLKYVKHKFEKQNKSSYIFSFEFNGVIQWVSVNEFVLSRHNPSNDVAFFAIGFSFLDKEASENAVLQLRLKQDMNLIGSLADEYLALFYLDMDDSSFKTYSLNDEIANFANSLIKENKDGIETIKEFGKSLYIHPDDHHIFENFSIDFIRENLKDSKKFAIRFRRVVNHEDEWFEMHVIKNENKNEDANIVVIGFAECGKEVRKEQILQKSFDVLTKDIGSFDAVNELLSYISEYYGGSRTVACEIIKTKGTVFISYEDIPGDSSAGSIKHNELPLSDIKDWIDGMSNGNAIIVDLNNSHTNENARKVLENDNTSELILVPMLNNGELVGFISIHNPTKALDDLTPLSTISAIIYSEILKRKEGDEEHITLEKVTNSFVSVFFADLNRDYAHNWKLSPEYRYDNSSDLAVSKFSSSFNGYVKNCICLEERERVLNEIAPKNILMKFQKTNIFSISMKDNHTGKDVYLVYDFIKVNDDGSQFVICSRDITSSIEKEREQKAILQEAFEKAENANKSKTNFLFNMSHDIRTPMNAIQGFTDMAIKYIDNKEKALDCLSKTQQSSDMLLSLINSVLEVSRIESGHAVLDESLGNVYACFKGLETTLGELADLKNISLKFSFENIKNENVLVDKSRCTRILVNIISNSIKYTNNGGKVSVVCSQTSEVQNGVANYTFVIKDNGIGMSEEFQKHIFEQFSREQNSTVSGIQGSGLGMSVVKSFVDLMGGNITCKSKLGEGTSFEVLLPLKVVEEENGDAAIDSEAYFKAHEDEMILKISNKLVLLVDDNALNREIAAEILSDLGIKCETAFDGAMALELIKEKGPNYFDFVLMDIQMPVMDGYEATRKIRELYPHSGLPVIALSANAFQEDKKASIEAGMNDHLAKPINIKELILCLSKFA